MSEQAGIANMLELWAGIGCLHFNQDSWLDLYVSNDFNQQDYLYLNNKNGTFRNAVKEATNHTSLFLMYSDAADINNDQLVDFIMLDMMPACHFILFFCFYYLLAKRVQGIKVILISPS